MKKLLLILAIPLLMGVGCVKTETLTNKEINEGLASGELACNTAKHCADLGFVCEDELNSPRCLTDYDLAGRIIEYPVCICINPNLDY
ncbi:MAG: hypothetical protein HOE19_00485 [Candidatus Komeilibacteria bacterium]|jgi:hypothetical protein|nr:hypothetical protein [Candidatus Komeilibacteria bacterium]MBT4447391.1 hypothetical protein [Candidatus Komeilibacteria bacterium]